MLLLACSLRFDGWKEEGGIEGCGRGSGVGFDNDFAAFSRDAKDCNEQKKTIPDAFTGM